MKKTRYSIESEIIELYRKTATELPNDVVVALKKAEQKEANRIAKEALGHILENISLAKKESKPICQDTGTPIFYIERPKKYSERELTKIIERATVRATEEIPLRPNAVNILAGKSIGNKPIIHFEESKKLEIELLLKGGGSENISAIYKLPNEELNADRDFDGVRKCILDSAFKAQGKGCPPYIIGVAIGRDIEEVAHLSKKQLLRKLSDKNSNKLLNRLETKTLKEINQLGIGPMGFGGKTAALALKIITVERHPATYFVGISFGCWCLRRQSICLD